MAGGRLHSRKGSGAVWGAETGRGGRRGRAWGTPKRQRHPAPCRGVCRGSGRAPVRGEPAAWQRRRGPARCSAARRLCPQRGAVTAGRPLARGPFLARGGGAGRGRLRGAWAARFRIPVSRAPVRVTCRSGEGRGLAQHLSATTRCVALIPPAHAQAAHLKRRHGRRRALLNVFLPQRFPQTRVLFSAPRAAPAC